MVHGDHLDCITLSVVQRWDSWHQLGQLVPTRTVGTNWDNWDQLDASEHAWTTLVQEQT